jgi:hypothetical protein
MELATREEEREWCVCSDYGRRWKLGDELFLCQPNLFIEQTQTRTHTCTFCSDLQKTKVILNVYDLSPANNMLYAIGFGLHHSGVEIMGDEYSFASGAGIFQSIPKDAPGAQFRESIELGHFDGGTQELKTAISEVRNDFGPDDYNLVRKNCNHFANALTWALLGRSIPAHVNRLADIGVCCSCLLPKQLLEHAPVGDTTEANSSSGFTRFGGPSSNKVTPAFSGTGSKLGSSGDTQSGPLGAIFGTSGLGSSKSTGDDLVDRRERARKAAMARLERNQKDGGGGNTSS